MVGITCAKQGLKKRRLEAVLRVCHDGFQNAARRSTVGRNTFCAAKQSSYSCRCTQGPVEPTQRTPAGAACVFLPMGPRRFSSVKRYSGLLRNSPMVTVAVLSRHRVPLRSTFTLHYRRR